MILTDGQIIDDSILCVHGGLSPDIRTLDQVRIIPRAQEVPHEGAFCGESSFGILANETRTDSRLDVVRSGRGRGLGSQSARSRVVVWSNSRCRGKLHCPPSL
jgi:diadenosine tetraphosphatase ApaH/serine/threonine PP2A family protein phosphatase